MRIVKLFSKLLLTGTFAPTRTGRSMKKFRQMILPIGAMCFMATASTANATAILPNPDVVDPADITVTRGSTPICPSGFGCGSAFISYVHNITDNGFTAGDTINSASLDIYLTDPGGPETIVITVALGGDTATQNNIGSSFTEHFTLSAASKLDLATDGLISVRIEVTDPLTPNPGNFVFDRSELTVDFTAQNAPEPASLALLGLGLAGLGFSRRKRAS